MVVYDYRLKELINNGMVRIALALPDNPIYFVDKTYWDGQLHQYYTVKDAKYTPYLVKGRPYLSLNYVTVQWEDGEITTHCTPLNPKKDYRIFLRKEKHDEELVG